MKLIKKIKKLLFIKNLMRKSLYIVFNNMNIYMLNQFYCIFENSEWTSKIQSSILHRWITIKTNVIFLTIF